MTVFPVYKRWQWKLARWEPFSKREKDNVIWSCCSCLNLTGSFGLYAANIFGLFIQKSLKTRINALMTQPFTPQVRWLWSVHRSSLMSRLCGRGQPLWRGWHCVHPPAEASPTAWQMLPPCNADHFPLTGRKQKPVLASHGSDGWFRDTVKYQ